MAEDDINSKEPSESIRAERERKTMLVLADCLSACAFNDDGYLLPFINRAKSDQEIDICVVDLYPNISLIDICAKTGIRVPHDELEAIDVSM